MQSFLFRLLAVLALALFPFTVASWFNRPKLATALGLATILGAAIAAFALEFRGSSICQAQFEAYHPVAEYASNCYEFTSLSFVVYSCSAVFLAAIFAVLASLVSRARQRIRRSQPNIPPTDQATHRDDLT